MRLATLRVHYQFVLWQKLVGHLYSRLEETTRVVAKVDNEVLAALLRQLGQSNEHVGISSFAEVLNADIARIVVEHVGGSYAFLRDVAACDGKFQRLFMPITQYADAHLCVFRTFQSAHGLVVGNGFAHKGLSVYAHHLIAGQQSCSFGRCILYHVLHVQRVFADVELDTHARERPFQLVVGGLHVFGCDVNRVRIEVG